MNARDLLLELERLHVELHAEGENLEYEGPEEAITPELLDRLRQRKAVLLELLSGDPHPDRFVCPDGLAFGLRATGWKPKERGGKTIWQSPESGFWYSQEVALRLSENLGMA